MGCAYLTIVTKNDKDQSSATWNRPNVPVLFRSLEPPIWAEKTSHLVQGAVTGDLFVDGRDVGQIPGPGHLVPQMTSEARNSRNLQVRRGETVWKRL